MSEWSMAKLQDVANIRASNVDKKPLLGEQSVCLCNYMDVYANNYITTDMQFMEATANVAELERFGIEHGDVMLTKDSETPDDIGIPSVVVDHVERLVCGYHLALLKPMKAKVDSVYLAKQLASNECSRYYSRLANGSTRYGLSQRAIAETPVPLPPLPQQRRIAEILSTVDEAIEQTVALIAKMQKVKAGLMHDLFTRGVTPEGKLRPPREEAPELYKESVLGWIPREWEATSFGRHLVSMPQNGLYKPQSSYGINGIPIVRIDGFYDGVLADPGQMRRLHVTPTELATYKLQPNDILVNRVNSIDFVGKSAIVPVLHEDVVFESNIMRCRVDAGSLLPRFAIRWLCGGNAVSHFRTRARSAVAQASVNQQDIKSLPLSMPPNAEQERISERVDSLDEALQQEIGDREKLRCTKGGLMHDLLTGRVRVTTVEATDV